MVRRVSSPYSVNAVALALLPTALSDAAYLSSYVSQVKNGREQLRQELCRLGIHCWPSRANFLLLRIGERHREFVGTMRQRGILVRDRSSDPGCDACVRITIGTTEQTDRLIATLHEVALELKLGSEVTA